MVHAICVVTITLGFSWSVAACRGCAFASRSRSRLCSAVGIALEEPIVQGLMRVVAAISSELVAFRNSRRSLKEISFAFRMVWSEERSLQRSSLVANVAHDRLLFRRAEAVCPIISRVILVSRPTIAFSATAPRFFSGLGRRHRNSGDRDSWHDFAGYGSSASCSLARSRSQRC